MKSCIWNISVPHGWLVRMSIDVTSLKDDICSYAYGYVEVLDGPSLTSPLITQECGRLGSNRISSSTNDVLVKLVPSPSGAQIDFRAKFWKIQANTSE